MQFTVQCVVQCDVLKYQTLQFSYKVLQVCMHKSKTKPQVLIGHYYNNINVLVYFF